tara:strand:- start:256 stop:1101 length:846 start_codon:yes stop_codon:yes gene_type:complete
MDTESRDMQRTWNSISWALGLVVAAAAFAALQLSHSITSKEESTQGPPAQVEVARAKHTVVRADLAPADGEGPWLFLQGDAQAADGALLRHAVDGVPVTGEQAWRSRPHESDPVALAAYIVQAKIDEVVLVRVHGAETFWVAGIAHQGDPEGRAWPNVPVALTEGSNEILIPHWHVGVDVHVSRPTRPIDVVLEGANPRLFTKNWPLDAEIPVVNVSSDTIEHLHMHYGHWVDATEPTKVVEPVEASRQADWQHSGSTVSWEYGVAHRLGVVFERVPHKDS